MPPPEAITADSFRFKRPLPIAVRRKTKTPMRRRRPTLSQPNPLINNNNRSFTLDLESLEDDQAPISSAERSTVLERVIVLIDKSLWESQRLVQMCTAMGAKVADAMGKNVTHVVHSPTSNNGVKQRVPRLVTQALEARVRLVNPQWVIDCYEMKERRGESYYPYDTDPSLHVPRLSIADSQGKRVHQEDNPFKVDPAQFGLSSDEEEEQEEEEQQPNGQGQQESSSSTDEEDEQMLLRRREKRSAAITKILQAVQASKERSKQQQEQQQQPSPFLTDDLQVGNLGSEERMQVWYGEQSFYSEEPKGKETARRGRGRRVSSPNKRHKGSK
ncbi:hypothetical protein BJV82DRAFT_596306 [Fennellomyces sp. T-0311]|nr:hypothetical protein BJV82DRAFT_596306 [Fennellomyces sp. T-0311]